MNTQITAVHKLMEILDDNAQQVPEGFYLEFCHQLKNLHMDINRKPTGGISRSALEEYERQLNNAAGDLHRKELEMRETQNRLNRQARELNDLKELVNKSVRNYNKNVFAYKEKKKDFERKEAELKVREKLMEDFEDNITLAELQRTLTGI